MKEERLKKLKAVKLIYKDHTPEQIVEIFNKELPISLKYNEDLINRISDKYPLLTKAEIAVIVTGVFQSIRDLLLMGKAINVKKLLCNLKLRYLKYKNNYKLKPMFVTPRHFKEKNEQS
jgi:hypothetical protein